MKSGSIGSHFIRHRHVNATISCLFVGSLQLYILVTFLRGCIPGEAVAHKEEGSLSDLCLKPILQLSSALDPMGKSHQSQFNLAFPITCGTWQGLPLGVSSWHLISFFFPLRWCGLLCFYKIRSSTSGLEGLTAYVWASLLFEISCLMLGSWRLNKRCTWICTIEWFSHLLSSHCQGFLNECTMFNFRKYRGWGIKAKPDQLNFALKSVAIFYLPVIDVWCCVNHRNFN